ncbi:MAG TPA: RNA methyltransferase [Clostridiales bacterium]|jgi:TrmH family RNA methyltransferase|nr:RNA methyltransferase [Clostridiales bacterium]
MFRSESITSRRSETVLRLLKLRKASGRRESGRFLFEGKKLFSEALDSKMPLAAVYATEENLTFAENELIRVGADSVRLFSVTDEVYMKLTDESAPQGLLCECLIPYELHTRSNIVPVSPGNRLFCAVGIQDPGNLGAIIRSAHAFGVGRLIISGCADLYNTKTVRGAMGALFRTKISVCSDITGALEALTNAGYSPFAAVLSESASPLHLLDEDPTRFYVVGSEGRGLEKEVVDACKGQVYIPMEKGSESLNAAVAASVLMFSQYIKRL